MAKSNNRLSEAEVAEYWSQRLREADPLSAVLTFNAPSFINEAYDAWEKKAFREALEGKKKNGPKLKGKSALDIACGIGRITQLLAGFGADTTAVDISPAMISRAKKRCRGMGVTFVEGAADELPFVDCRFDLITCFGLLEHLPEGSRLNCLSEIRRLLKRSGRSFLVVNNSECLFLKGERLSVARRGYHVEVVGLRWLEGAASRVGLSCRIRAANPGYAIAHYGIWGNRGAQGKLDKEIRKATAAVIELDGVLPAEGELTRQLASHFLVECRPVRSKH